MLSVLRHSQLVSQRRKPVRLQQALRRLASCLVASCNCRSRTYALCRMLFCARVAVVPCTAGTQPSVLRLSLIFLVCLTSPMSLLVCISLVVVCSSRCCAEAWMKGHCLLCPQQPNSDIGLLLEALPSDCRYLRCFDSRTLTKFEHDRRTFGWLDPGGPSQQTVRFPALCERVSRTFNVAPSTCTFFSSRAPASDERGSVPAPRRLLKTGAYSPIFWLPVFRTSIIVLSSRVFQL